ncbi:hypothetical protein HHE02_12420 [Helicobacter heilmannii]|uniref:DUF2130 domain-containing protein n=1 Tax=Helicobacter heilmannii TaxID=35817 RepID=UPI0006A1C8F5|nr:DUF2130 domain-containing protein [Helicobacter heilmannii]CRF47941.1 hypothetical protein HHE02_12420 [Helicobacter heilmannii]
MNDSITCPHCQHTFSVGEILSKQVAQELEYQMAQEKENFAQEVAQKRQEYTQAFRQLESQKQAIQEQIQQEQARLSTQMAKNQQETQETLRQLELQKQTMQAQVQHGIAQALEKERAQMQEQIQQEQARLQVQNAIQLQAQQEMMEKTLRLKLQEENELPLKEAKKQIEDLQKAVQELTKKAQPTISQQLQGEVQELAIEEHLRLKFPLDDIQEVPKGAKGADCLQIVRDERGQDCGVICYESKRAQHFKEEWIDKLTQNKRECGAHLGVLVTQALPKGIERMGLYKGVYVCTFQEFKGLCGILREMVLSVALAQRSQDNKSDKVRELYNYLVGVEFAREVSDAIALFQAMQHSLNEEKKAAKNYMSKLEKQWAKREKQIEGLHFIVARTRGCIEGIAGNAIAPLKVLELGADDDDTEVMDA